MFESIVENVHSLLDENRGDWEDRYAAYASKIFKNKDEIIAAKEKFREWKPLFVYTNLTKAMKGDSFQLRYRGQHVANLRFKDESVQIKIDDKQKVSNGNNFPGCPDFSGWQDWKGKEAKDLRAFFKNDPDRTKGAKDNDEHRIESLMLSAFGGEGGAKQVEGLRGIKPVKLFDIARFQFPTPLNASDSSKTYSGASGGGIDILARDKRKHICVMEIKCKPGNVKNVLKQGLAYAVFVRELLRSKSGEEWYQLLGFTGKIPSGLQINVVAIMPDTDKSDVDLSFAENELSLGGNDKAVLHYFFFTESDDKKSITAVKTSL